MDTVEIVDDIWNKTEEFMQHLAGSFMQYEYIGNEDDLYLFQMTHESKESHTWICPDDRLCQCGAGVRVTETKRKLILEFKGKHDKNSHRLRIAARLLLVVSSR
jgi:hypothetical protein